MKAVGYIRVSTLKQDDSYEVQIERIESYCRFHNLQLDKIFYDNGISGTIPISERPEGFNMMNYIRQKDILNMVGMKLDRFFRDTVDALNTVKHLDKNGISVHIVDMGGTSINTSSAVGKMMLTMLAGFAEMERNLISERTSAALQSKKARGIAYTREIYGFKKVDGRFIPDDSELKDVRDIYRARSLNLGFQRIADLMNGAGGKKIWHKSTIRSMLKNDIYQQYINA